MSCEKCAHFVKEDESFIPDCPNCLLPRLLPENEEALNIYMLLNTSFSREFGALPLVLEIYNLKLTRREAKLLLKKLIMIHDLLRVHHQWP